MIVQGSRVQGFTVWSLILQNRQHTEYRRPDEESCYLNFSVEIIVALRITGKQLSEKTVDHNARFTIYLYLSIFHYFVSILLLVDAFFADFIQHLCVTFFWSYSWRMAKIVRRQFVTQGKLYSEFSKTMNAPMTKIHTKCSLRVL